MKLRTLSIALALAAEPNAPDALPSEFRLFVSGWNDTENGRYLFDEAAAEAVMAASAKWGVDHMIDLEHQSLVASTPPEPTARDARGWFNLDLREDGSLWAVNVRWTTDGAARLREKRQRYVSPAFDVDKDGRVTKIINVAITAIPATHETPALVAASTVAGRTRDARKLAAGPSFADVGCAIEKALRDRYPDWPFMLDVFDATVVFESGGKLWEIAWSIDAAGVVQLAPTAAEVKRTYAPVAPPPAPAAPAAPAANRTSPAKKLAAGGSMDWKKEALDAVESGDGAKALELLKGMLAGGTDPAGEPPEAEPGAAATAAPAAPAEDPKKAEEMAAARVVLALSGKSDPVEAKNEIERLVKLARELETRDAALQADRATLEATERRQLTAKLVTLGAETPATAWADPLAPTTPCKRLAEEPLDELRARVSKLAAARGVTLGATTTPPASSTTAPQGGRIVQTSLGPVTLSARELAMIDEMKGEGVTAESYAAAKAAKGKKA